MKNIKPILFSISFVIILISCSSTKNIETVKVTNEQKAMALEYSLKRVNYLSTQEFSKEIKQLFSKLKYEIPKYTNGKSNNVSEIAVKLAKIIPEQDFVKMFNSQNDYQYKGKWLGNEMMSNKLNDLNKNSLRTLGGNRLNLQQQNKPDLKPDCNCNWTCDGNSGTYHNECLITVAGCGFLLLQPCTGI